jgi:LacI family transcriptional regulator
MNRPSAQNAAGVVSGSPPELLVLAGDKHPQIIEGIAAWARENGPWAIRHRHEAEPNWRRRPLPAGVLADTDYSIRPFLEAYMHAGVPAVLFSETPLETPSRVVPDNEAVGELAMSHFRDLHLEHVAYVGQPEILLSRQRLDGLTRAAAEDGATVHDFGRNVWSGLHWYEGEYEILVDWLRSLPKPVGLLCHFAEVAQRMITFLAQHGMAVPEDVAVLSAERSDLVSTMCVPSLSMVDLGEFRIGYEAADLLQRQISGRDLNTHRVVVPPAGIIAQGSTDILAVDSPRLARAIRYIRRHACEGIGVEDIVSACGLSRRGLEVAMRRNFGRTVQDEIKRIRVAEAKLLLSSTSLPIADIGPRCGFEWGTTLNAVFRRETGMTPRDYRKLCRGEPIARTEG